MDHKKNSKIKSCKKIIKKKLKIYQPRLRVIVKAKK